MFEKRELTYMEISTGEYVNSECVGAKQVRQVIVIVDEAEEC